MCPVQVLLLYSYILEKSQLRHCERAPSGALIMRVGAASSTNSCRLSSCPNLCYLTPKLHHKQSQAVYNAKNILGACPRLLVSTIALPNQLEFASYWPDTWHIYCAHVWVWGPCTCSTSMHVVVLGQCHLSSVG